MEEEVPRNAPATGKAEQRGRRADDAATLDGGSTSAEKTLSEVYDSQKLPPGCSIPLKRKADIVKGKSKKRKDQGKHSPEENTVADDTVADARADARASSPSTPSSDSDGDSDDDGDDGDESNEDDSSDDSDVDIEVVDQPRTSKSLPNVCEQTYSRFDPGAPDHVVVTLPTQDMVDYVTRRFTVFVTDKKIRETIGEECPVPTGVPGLEVPTVDDYISDIFQSRKQDYGKATDDTWVKVQNRIVDVMGPLSKLWTVLEEHRVDEATDELDLFDCLQLVEKVITLVGQAHISVSYYRRHNILSRLTKDNKKAKQLLRQLDVSEQKKHDKLFGKSFYKKLSKSAKVSKVSKEISTQLGEGPKKFKQYSNNSSSKKKGGDQQQPFQKGSSSSNRGGGRKVSFTRRGKGSGNRGKFLVRFNCSQNHTCKEKSTCKQSKTCSEISTCKHSKTCNEIPTCNIRLSRKTKCSLKSPKNRGGDSGVREPWGLIDELDIHPALHELALTPMSLPDRVGGRLRFCLQNWEKLTGDQFVLRVVKGMEIPFVDWPVQMTEPHQYPFSVKEKGLVETEVKGMMEKGAITQVNPSLGQFVSPLFLVPKKDGSQRPVINLKKLNSHVLYEHFKMEGLHLLKDLVQPHDFMVKVDLKDAYFSVPVKEQHCPFLRFRWGERLYQFNCMPFGLGPAPRIFTKIMKPIVAFLRRLGVRIIIYLDDMIILNQNSTELMKDLNSLLFLLTRLGFAINWKKSALKPTQTLEFLGFLIDTVKMTMSLPEDKVSKLTQKCLKLISEKTVKVRAVAEVVGLFTSSVRAILPAPLHYRHLQMAQTKGLLVGQSYETKITLSLEALKELRWWVDNIRGWNGKAIMTPSPDMTIDTDASLSGWGAVWKHQKIGGVWTPEEANLHINVLELTGALFAVRAFAKDKQNAHVHLRMDNVSAVTYIQKMGGTRSSRLLEVAGTLWDFCLQRNILLSAEYLPGSLNGQADWESRHSSDTSDWQLDKSLFQAINQRWGPLEMDLFASRHNAQLSLYVSWKPDPFAMAVDAFLMDWNRGIPYLFPPFSMLTRCLAKIWKDRATVVVVTPTWQSQPWYPSLLEMVVDLPVLLPQTRDMLKSPRGDLHPLMGQMGLQLAAWKVSGDRHFQKEFQSTLPTCWPNTPGVRARDALTRAPGDSGVAGVTRNKLIQFAPLWSLS